MILMTNQARQTPLLVDPILTELAQDRADYLCKHAFSHDHWTDWNSGYSYRGENLAKNFTSPKKEHKALLNSPTHKKNIVKKEYTAVGIAHKKCGDNEYGTKNITVELFGG